jgi:hypothetical protein
MVRNARSGNLLRDPSHTLREIREKFLGCPR